jgi:hypothetical protein
MQIMDTTGIVQAKFRFQDTLQTIETNGAEGGGKHAHKHCNTRCDLKVGRGTNGDTSGQCGVLNVHGPQSFVENGRDHKRGQARRTQGHHGIDRGQQLLFLANARGGAVETGQQKKKQHVIKTKQKDRKKDDGAHKLGTKQKCFEANLRFVQLMIAPE